VCWPVGADALAAWESLTEEMPDDAATEASANVLQDLLAAVAVGDGFPAAQHLTHR
jgi:hypothetical protein